MKSWKSIVAGVDFSEEGVHAAVVASALAQSAGTRCHLVHAVRDPWTATWMADAPMDLDQHRLAVLDSARSLLLEGFRERVGDEALRKLTARFGSPPVVVAEAADQHDAEMVVLGGKHHSTIGRWLAGSTVQHLVRTMNRPIFVAGPVTGPLREFRPIKRVLVAVDLSSASILTLNAAERFAGTFGAELCIIHVIEPMPIIPELPVGMDIDVARRSEEELENSIWPRVTMPNVERLVRNGPAAETIGRAVTQWKADLLVVGSHGRGWVDRVLIGSVTEKLLNLLPTSMLVLPVASPATMPVRSRAVAPRLALI